ncbi:YihY/virulence factor BrkB family protein [Marisediminicola senii]|uniref:YihY/virulence factor BrkB family protein n=1 Tax=Marisediminicola senii TaxID=2711233 RepID=UPI0013EB5124|nr:YihY/virulence factor BrkB family protein [Marisediminicola senii]
MAENAKSAGDPPPAGGAPLIDRIFALKIVRLWFRYLERGGLLMAFGLSYQALFAVFAGLWVGFSIAGFVIQGNVGLQESLIDTIAESAPGLIETSTSEGAIDPQTLLETQGLTWTGSIAIVGLLLTALGWLASARTAVRTIFDLAPGPVEFLGFLLLKLKDLGLGLLFGVALVVSTVLSTVSTTLLRFSLDLIGVGSDSLAAVVLTRIVGLTVVLLIDTTVLAALYRVLAQVPIPFRRLVSGALIGGVALGALKFLGGALLGGASRNPLLASFAVIIGLLIFFNLACQVILLSATWIAVGMEDAGIAADPKAEAERIERERLIERGREAEEADARPGGFARLWQRVRGGGSPAPGDAAGVDGGDADRTGRARDRVGGDT